MTIVCAHVFSQNPEQRSSFCKLMAALCRLSKCARPTQFHQLLKALDDRGTLLRVYTQNIDGLESKAGLIANQPGSYQLPLARCIRLHGSLEHMRCQTCQVVEIQEPYDALMSLGSLPKCMSCDRLEEERQKMGKRSRRVPLLLPNVVLYDQVHPEADYIGSVMMEDLKLNSNLDGGVDFLLVVGTSMKVPGTIKAIKAFAKTIQQRRMVNGIHTLYVNLDFQAQSNWSGVFDAWIQADCQTFAGALLSRIWSEGNLFLKCDILNSKFPLQNTKKPFVFRAINTP
jgi:NAD-dependent SIR2 family protein deacetylase